MDFSLSDDQVSVRDLSRQLLADVAPTAGTPAPAGPDWYDSRLWARLGEAGLLGIALPVRDGGAGYGPTELALLAEEAGRTVARVPIAACLGGAALPLAEYGTPTQRSRLLAGVVAGTELLSAAFTEPFADDPLAPVTAAVPEGTGWRVSGTKTAVPLARTATAVLLPASAPDGQVVLALVHGGTAGVTFVDEQTSSGEPACTITLDGALVSAEDTLAGGRTALRFAYQRYLALLCATELGIAAEALRMAAAHTSTREQFGRPLATFQAVAVRLGNGFIDVQAMQSTLWQALWRLEAGLPADEAVITAAFWAAEAGERVLTSAVHLHGGLGVDTDYPLHRWFLASKVVELALGGASWQLDQLGRILCAGPA